MKYRLFLTFLVFNLQLNLFAFEIINGDVKILKIPKNEAGELYINNKKSFWIQNPTNKNEMIAVISANYKNNKDIVVKNVLNNTSKTITLKLVKGKYNQEKLSVNPSKVNPPKSVLKRIKSEASEARAIYAKTTPKYYFNSPFLIPLNSKITSNFGTARVFNGSLKSYHSGTDFRARTPIPIRASNDGIVRIARNRYYSGNSVVIDHGGGIYSQYYHFSKINVKVGDRVKKGDILGLSGASGRVNGPHLHFGFVINSNQVNAINFINKMNSLIFNQNGI